MGENKEILIKQNKVKAQSLVFDWVVDGIDRNQLESGGNCGWLNLEGVSSGRSTYGIGLRTV